ncbi:hypothetical protein CBOM_07434 [Ceraceosorus bombacis]|uniref:Uncharacterized protein n=1 Tax=Ceraceosorus bombacis TaxID=401625 RepID=A0A0N7L9D9_9BASI|nr:hypothetical protein CBOM_07434 [Ceraceosorus bombacis]
MRPLSTRLIARACRHASGGQEASTLEVMLFRVESLLRNSRVSSHVLMIPLHVVPFSKNTRC